MDMTTQFEYVVLRLSPDAMRGENVNVGLAIFPEHGLPIVRITASIAKIRALDPSWTRVKAAALQKEIARIAAIPPSTQGRIELISSFGYCLQGEPGFFFCSEARLEAEIRELSNQYISNRKTQTSPQRRNKLHQEMVSHFRNKSMLGSGVDDLQRHLVIPHFPIPGNPDLKGDFLYLNGGYHITQTLDYRVSASAAHQKVTEACTKAMAATVGEKAWGKETHKYALVCVPPEVASIADAHLDLLYASGFEIFHADNPQDLNRYHSTAFPH